MRRDVNKMEEARRKIDAVISAMVRRSAVQTYTPAQLKTAYLDFFQDELPDGIDDPLLAETWEWLFSFRNEPHKFLRRGRSKTELDPLTTRRLRAIWNALRFLKVCIDAPEVTDDHASWVTFLDHVLEVLARVPNAFLLEIAAPLHFIGREQALEQLHTAMTRDEAPAVVIALHGLRGVGKTALAVAYAHRQREHYHLVAWIEAHSMSACRRAFIELGRQLRLIPERMRQLDAIAQMREQLAKGPEKKLLIFDNAPDIEAVRKLLPGDGACRVLITSNFHAWGEVATPMPVLSWPSRSGAEYLVTRTSKPEQRDAAGRLSDTLGGLPLALAQAAAYCARKEIPFSDYQALYERATAIYLDADPKDVAHDYHPERDDTSTRTVAGTFQ